MNRLTKYALLALAAVALACGSAMAQEEGGRRGGARGGMRDKARAWFMQLDDVKAAMEKHKETMKKMHEEMGTAIREKIAETRAGKEEGEEVDREAVKEELKEVVTLYAGKMVDERIRHSRQMADLMEEHKEEAIAKLIEALEKRKGQAGKRGEGRGGRQGRGGGGQGQGEGGGNMDEDFEGAIF